MDTERERTGQNENWERRSGSHEEHSLLSLRDRMDRDEEPKTPANDRGVMRRALEALRNWLSPGGG